MSRLGRKCWGRAWVSGKNVVGNRFSGCNLLDGWWLNKSNEPIKGRTFVKVGVFFFPWKRDTTDDDFHGKFVASLGADWHTWLDDGWWSFL